MKPEDFIKTVVARASHTNELELITRRLSSSSLIPLLHGALGASTEAGELVDQIKKHIFYGKDLDPIHLVEEVGDVLWYLATILHSLGYSFEECMKMNNRKLEARYGSAFGETQAKNRDLEKERKALEK